MRRTRIPVTLAMAGLVLGLAGTLSACGAAATSPGGPSPTAGAPVVVVVRLGAAFSPRTVRLGVGQQFVVMVSKTVKVSGDISGDCQSGGTSTAGDGVLSVRCSAGNYLYTAKRAGSSMLSATVRPRCKAGTICPQWVSEANLNITVT